MKKILLLLMLSINLMAQIKIENLPTTTTGSTSDYLIKNKAAGGLNSTQKMTVSSFLTTYIPSVFTSLTTNYVPKATSSTTLGNSLIIDNGTSVSIGNASPTASTAFEVNSTTGALLLPRMTTTQRNALTPLAGMIVHNTSLFTYDGYAAGSWYNFIGTNVTNTANFVPKFVTSTTITNSLFSDDGTTATVGIPSTTQGALNFASASNANTLILKAGVTAANTSYTLPTNYPASSGYALTSTTGGVMSWAAVSSGLTGATGDIPSFSATNTESRIAAVATGYLFGSQGLATQPAWLQAATLNTSLTTPLLIGGTAVGSAAEIRSTSGVGTTDHIKFTVGSNGATEAARIINSGAFLIGGTSALGSEQLLVSKNQNSSTIFRVNNTDVGGSASSGFYLGNGTSFVTFRYFGSGFITSGALVQNGGAFISDAAGGLSIGTSDATATYRIYTGGTAAGNLRHTISGAGLSTWTAAYHVFAAGTTAAGTAPWKAISGPLNTSPEIGTFEFLTDRVTFTTTTGTTRKNFDLLSYRATTALRTLDGSDNLVDCTSGTYTHTLPTAVGFTGEYIIKNSGTGIITLATTSSQTIDGYASATLVLNQYDSYTLRSNNANWIIIK